MDVPPRVRIGEDSYVRCGQDGEAAEYVRGDRCQAICAQVPVGSSKLAQGGPIQVILTRNEGQSGTEKR